MFAKKNKARHTLRTHTLGSVVVRSIHGMVFFSVRDLGRDRTKSQAKRDPVLIFRFVWVNPDFWSFRSIPTAPLLPFHDPRTTNTSRRKLVSQARIFWALSTFDPMPGCPWIFNFASRVCARCNGLVFLWVRIQACFQRVWLSLICSWFGRDRFASRILLPSPRRLSDCALTRKRGWCTIKRENKSAQPQ